MQISKREAEVIENIQKREIIFFGPKEIGRFLGIKKRNTYRILRNMKQKGLIKHIQRGTYILKETWDSLDIYELASNLLLPSYLGFYSALHFHKMTTQVPRTVFIATPKRKKDIQLQGEKIKFITIKEEFMFGYIRSGKTIVSNPEKTIIDCLKLPKYGGGIKNIYNSISKELDIDLLIQYCIKIQSSSIASRLGYILEKKNLIKQNKKKPLQDTITTYTKLDPKQKRKNLYPEWKIYANVDLK